MKRRGRPKKFPDYARVRRGMNLFEEMTRPERRLWLIEAIDADPDAIPGLSIQVALFARALEDEEAAP